ncbi:MAG: helix-turn-helix transcriptional regulator [Gammaproteobacteria bacterium]|nr:helix-turn-helix transcriptional regulator [Gammaproteobacteria bacterium]
MPGFSITSVTSHDGDVFFRELMGDVVHGMPTDDNGFFGKFEKIELNDLTVSYVRSRGRVALHRTPTPGTIMLIFPQTGNGNLIIYGRQFLEDAICVIGENGDTGFSLPNPANLVVLEIPIDQWRAAAKHTANPDLLEQFTDGVNVLRASGGLPTVASAVAQLRKAVATRNGRSPDVDAGNRGAVVIASAVKAVTARSNMRARLVASKHLCDCFTRAMVCVEEHLPAGLTVSELCAATGIHERTLQVAFRSIPDMTPGQYIRYRRLAACRQKLAKSHPDEVTVGGVAMEYGFLYPSQFAAYYGKAFGEKPSATLRRSPEVRARKVRERHVQLPETARLQLAGMRG